MSVHKLVTVFAMYSEDITFTSSHVRLYTKVQLSTILSVVVFQLILMDVVLIGSALKNDISGTVNSLRVNSIINTNLATYHQIEL